MRAAPLLLAFTLGTVLAGCQRPPASAYFGGAPEAAGSAVGLGADASGEACTQQSRGGAGGADIFCGAWTQPSGHVQRGGAADAAALPGLATSGAWRQVLDSRFACAAPVPTTIAGGAPAVAMQCTRKVGGWPQVAIVAAVNGTAYYADGIEPAEAVIQRGIGVMAGTIAPDAAATSVHSNADGLFSARLAAQAFSAGTIAQYERLMLEGAQQNLEENFTRAETVYRAAQSVQEKALGRTDPNVATPLMHVALQVSDEGRFAEADGLFARAADGAARAADPTVRARLLHYRALHALNQKKYPEALALLQQADAAYAAQLPPGDIAPRPRAGSPTQVLAASGGGTRSDPLPKDDVILDPTEQTALVGVIETRRNQSIVLRALNRTAESDQAISDATMLADAHGMRTPKLTSRLYRTAAANSGAQGNVSDATSGLSYSTAAFGLAYPGTRPLAATRMLHAAELRRGGDTAAALRECRGGVALLHTLKLGVDDDVLEPCLDTFAEQAGAEPAADGNQALLAEMFQAAQLSQGSVTGQLIAGATARLVANARDPKVGAAVRRRQDAQSELDTLLEQRDVADAPPAAASSDLRPRLSSDELDRRIAAARAEAADADAALQAAAPNFGQLVQDTVPASAVFGALGADEAFSLITLGARNGWVFVLHDGRIGVARTSNGAAAMTALVKRVRAGIEIGERDVPRFDTADAQAIYADTLGRLEPRLAGAKSLVVAPAGPLLSLPFAVLLTGPADPDRLAAAPWLLRRFDIAHVPAAANFVSLRKSAGLSRANRPWFGMGDFRPVTLAEAQRSFPSSTCADSAQLFAGLGSLATARRELDAARALLGAPASDELLGGAFTARAVQQADLSRYRVLHFAAHALLPSELRCQPEPAIVTSPPAGALDASGALLTASDVLGTKLDADLVILSACNSGGPGNGTGGESLSGLARSFFYAGARTMMVTHWSVNDQTAAYLVASTIGRLRDGAGVAGAMRASQLSMLDGAGTTFPAAIAHPFYWAPFAVIGEGRTKIVAAGAPSQNPTPVAGL